MSKRDPKILIDDILESAKKIKEYISGLDFDSFLRDDKTLDAVIRNFEIIGEAARNFPNDFRSTYSQLDWERIIGFRNRIVHDYMGIDYSIVWEIIKYYLPRLINELEKISDDL